MKTIIYACIVSQVKILCPIPISIKYSHEGDYIFLSYEIMRQTIIWSIHVQNSYVYYSVISRIPVFILFEEQFAAHSVIFFCG